MRLMAGYAGGTPLLVEICPAHDAFCVPVDGCAVAPAAQGKQRLSGRLTDEATLFRHGAGHPVRKLTAKILYIPHIDACISSVAPVARNSVLLMDRTLPFRNGP